MGARWKWSRQPRREREFEQLAADGIENFLQEYRILRADGDVLWVDERTSVSRHHDGRVAHYESVLTDISERKALELALRKREEQYRHLFEANPQPMWVHDLDTLRFLAVNDAAIVHYGYTREQLLAMTSSRCCWNGSTTRAT